ncbi:hypothetical protein GHT06_012439 [Daphnia sinensis]|uniref:Uncharacterized protein n=1 Tax=Daphnia sinensis TaxID=1820382 RepID=A0AAD5PVP4_9CRUS|nr:hypothetical protein GHT06_012439 [Daphnia sinensis]
MAHHHLLLLMVGASALMTAINLMEAKPVPARRSSSTFAGFHHSLFGSMDDVSAVPTMMMMPSFVYYQMMAPFHSPFHRMIKSARWLGESSEEEEEDEHEDDPEEMEEGGSKFGKKETKKSTADRSLKVSQTESKKGGDKSETSEPLKDAKEAKLVKKEEQPQKECPKETKSEVSSEQKKSVEQSPKEEESQRKSEEKASDEPEEEAENEEEVENEEAESMTERDEEETLTTESPTTESPSQESTLTLIAETTTQSQTESIIERMMPDAPKVSGPTKSSARSSSITYVCKHGKCQHNAEAKKLLEQEIEAELWAKLK